MGEDEASIRVLSKRLGHEFSNTEFIHRALTHSSSAEDFSESNERLEFLGDRVLGLVVAEILLERFPSEKEGQIARRLSKAVDQDSLARVAESIALQDFIRVGPGELKNGTRKRKAVVADSMEAIIGAVYLDAGLEIARSVISEMWMPMIDAFVHPPLDAKTELQEWAQGRGLGLPSYELIKQTGPDHEPAFLITVSVRGYGSANGKGGSKRAAEQCAAETILRKIGTK
ncbi:MAG: ribonuclease III [Rhodospirillaceae bacterium]